MKPPLTLAWSVLLMLKAGTLLTLEGASAWVDLLALVAFLVVFEESRTSIQAWLDGLPLWGLVVLSTLLGWSTVWGWVFSLATFLVLLEQRRISPLARHPN